VHGPGRLRAQLVLVHEGGASITVGEETRPYVEGEAFVFDDSFEHSVVHEGDANRVVLIVDVWHPDLPQHLRRMP
jgi:aspartate beta-hydroxylase